MKLPTLRTERDDGGADVSAALEGPAVSTGTTSSYRPWSNVEQKERYLAVGTEPQQVSRPSTVHDVPGGRVLPGRKPVVTPVHDRFNRARRTTQLHEVAQPPERRGIVIQRHDAPAARVSRRARGRGVKTTRALGRSQEG